MLCENKCINVVWKKIKKLGRKKIKVLDYYSQFPKSSDVITVLQMATLQIPQKKKSLSQDVEHIFLTRCQL